MHVAFTGHTPEFLGGYSQRDEWLPRLKKLVRRVLEQWPCEHAYSDMEPGFGQAAAEVLCELDVPWTAVCSDEHMADAWEPAEQQEWEELLSRARERVFLTTPGKKCPEPGLNSRWAVLNCQLVVTAYSGGCDHRLQDVLRRARGLHLPVLNAWPFFDKELPFYHAWGDLFTFPLGDAGARVVTTNTTLDKQGNLVMGAGVARDAAKIFPELPQKLGDWTRQYGGRVFWSPQERVLAMPTKTDWRKPSTLDLVEKSLGQLRDVVDKYQLRRVVMTRPGCGNGGLEWEDVWPLCNGLLDDRFVVLDSGRL